MKMDYRSLSIKKIQDIALRIDDIPLGSETDFTDNSDDDPTFTVDKKRDLSCIKASPSDSSDVKDNIELPVTSDLQITPLEGLYLHNNTNSPNVPVQPGPSHPASFQNRSLSRRNPQMNLVHITLTPTQNNRVQVIQPPPSFLEN